MADDPAWRSLTTRPARPPFISPFNRLARLHAFAQAGEALVAIALAGSLFFDISPSAARGKVALYLIFPIAPFAVISPLVGPLLDRVQGGRRLVIAAGMAIRALVCFAMSRHHNSGLLFPEAFMLLVLSKTYAIGKSATVPTVVENDEELVEANSKLGLLSGIAGFSATLPTLLVRWIFGSGGVCVVAGLLFAVATALALRVPAGRAQRRTQIAGDDTERNRRPGGIALAGSAMAVVRACVGFLAFHLAFWLRSEGSSTAWFGVILGVSAIGSLIGNAAAPMLRSKLREEFMLMLALGAIVGSSLAALSFGGLAGAAVLTAFVGAGGAVGRLAFDSIVQRDGHEANRGRAFARFETRFQLCWVVAAFIPVVITLPESAGFAIVGLAAAFGLGSYLIGTNYLKKRGLIPRSLVSRLGAEVRKRRAAELGRTQRPRPPQPR